MKNTLRCCISCILPCGSLDVIRIVHANGHVEEISSPVSAAEIMKLHPKHILKKPSSSTFDNEGVCIPKIVVVPPDAELQRGKIYFLMPLPPEKTRSKSITKRSKKKEVSENNDKRSSSTTTTTNSDVTNVLLSDRYLSELLSENVSTQKNRRRGRVGVWRPHLESICETPSSDIA